VKLPPIDEGELEASGRRVVGPPISERPHGVPDLKAKTGDHVTVHYVAIVKKVEPNSRPPADQAVPGSTLTPQAERVVTP
jgi:hypothetical protein